MNKYGYLSVCIALLAVLAGCATTPPQFVAQVTVRHNIASDVHGKRFLFAQTANQTQSLLEKQVQAQVANQLIMAGLQQAAVPGDADWLVSLSYGVDNGQIIVTQEPIWGPVGYDVYYGRYPGYGGYFYSPMFYPQTGIVGMQPIQTTIYTSTLAVDISDRRLLQSNQFAKLYEGKAINRSQQQDLDWTLPWLARALLQSFPGFSGQTTTVRIPLQQAATPAAPATAPAVAN
ncbi:DUF4136 domain-containing protein [Amantichitinum ursilacus]|uniref:DUF4136 domain-containing protein n=1 Tax=Amantichitinum ursilacus TaxID=857265 RepID=A0A0N0GMJ2_9NEIS|nr:DUF4136 domain-containing protein [Amantichitinum ursilacus]KPC51608.1 hypothetical protein WG78_15365 [Amantichitinum ursilacus]